MAVRAWNLLGGLEWSGLEIVANILGIEDIEMLVVQLKALRDNPDKLKAASAN